MKTVILEIASPEGVSDDLLQAWNSGRRELAARIGFATPELLWKVLTARRWEMLKSLAGAGPLGVRELARRLHRDVKAVHTDATVLAKAGVIDRLDDGKLLFPYDKIEVRFDLTAAA